MRILGCIGTFNHDISDSLKGLLQQTHPVEHILLVDNMSTRNVIPEPLPRGVEVVRTEKNIGPNSAIRAGLEYALANGYEWIWLLESDGVAEPDSLEKLIGLNRSLDPSLRSAVGILCSTQVLLPSGNLFQGRRLTKGGPRLPIVHASVPYCECDSVMWNGSLINLKAVREVGFPRSGTNGAWEDLSYDFGDTEYTYRIRAAGYRLLVHTNSFVLHRTGSPKSIRLLGRDWHSTNHSPARRYLFFRNLVYFWLHIYPAKNWPLFLLWFCYRFSAISLGIVVIEEDIFRKIHACLRGIRDGWKGDLQKEYGAPPAG